MTTVRMFGEYSVKWSSDDDGAKPRPVFFSSSRRLNSILILIWATDGMKTLQADACRLIYGTHEEKDRNALKRIVDDYFPTINGKKPSSKRKFATLGDGERAVLEGLRRSRGGTLSFQGKADVDVQRFWSGTLQEKLALYQDVLLPTRDDLWVESLRSKAEDELAKAIIKRSPSPGSRASEAEFAGNVARLLALYSKERIGRVIQGPEDPWIDDSARRLYKALIRLAVSVSPKNLTYCRDLFEEHGRGRDEALYEETIQAFALAIKLTSPPPVTTSRSAVSPDDEASVTRFVRLAEDNDVEGALRLAVEAWEDWSPGTWEIVGRPWLHSLTRQGSKDPVLQGEALVLLAGVSNDLRDFHATREAIVKLEMIPREFWGEPTSNGRPLQARALTVVANYSAEMGYARIARECLTRAKSLLDADQHRAVAFQLGVNRETTFIDEGKPERAIEGLEKLRDSEKVVPFVESSLLHNLGAAYIEAWADLSQARICLGKALALREGLSANHYAQTTIELARLEFREGNLGESIRLLEGAVAVEREVDTAFASAHLFLSACRLAKGDRNDCREELKQAFVIVQAGSDPRRFASLAERGASYLFAVSRDKEAESLLQIADRIRNWRKRTPYEDWLRDSIRTSTGDPVVRQTGRIRNRKIDIEFRSIKRIIRTAII